MSMTFRFALICLLTFLTAACSSASFHQEKNNTQRPPLVASESAEQTPSLNRKNHHPGFADPSEDQPGETEHALPPQEVSGSWLACVPLEDGKDRDLVGCAIVRRGLKQNVANSEMTWYVEDPAGKAVAIEVQRARDVDPWHVTLRSAQSLELARVSVVLKMPARKPVAYTTTIFSMHAQAAQTDPDQAFHVGDGSFSASSCAASLANVPVSGKRWKAEVETGGRGPWLVTVSGLCGVDDRATARVLIETDLGVTEVLNEGTETSLTVWIPVHAGRWSIAVIAEDRTPSDIEDFLFTGLKVQGGGDVNLNVR